MADSRGGANCLKAFSFVSLASCRASHGFQGRPGASERGGCSTLKAWPFINDWRTFVDCQLIACGQPLILLPTSVQLNCCRFGLIQSCLDVLEALMTLLKCG